MTPNRDYLLAAFIVAALMGISAMWAADVQLKRQSAADSLEAVKVALTPFERDRRAAVEKAKLAGIDTRWVEGK